MSNVLRTAILSTLVAGLLGLAACTGPDEDGYRPSLTQVRIGEVVVDDPPPIPEALYVPGINVKPEDYDLQDAMLYLSATDLQNLQDLDDPKPLEKHAEYAYEAGTGSLLDENPDEGEMNYDDVEQGAIGDCYFPAALAATIFIDEDHGIRDGLIREVRDESGFVTHYVVRYYDAWGTRLDIEVDADLVRKGTKVTYARSMDSTTASEEWWVSLVEKAYAEWHGGYEKIGEGGWVGDVFQALTGSNATYRNLKYLSDDSIVRSITDNIERHRPVAAGTFGEDSGVEYEGTGVYANHAYSILGARTDEEGVSHVTLRNPWGEVEPAGNGEDDGIFELTTEEFKRLYQGLTLGGGYEADHTAPDEVDDLEVAEIVGDTVVLTFTSTGDDGTKGLAALYDLRSCGEEISSSNFYSCEKVAVAGPQSPGTVERIEVEGVEGNTWFAVKVEDESGNISGLSNVAHTELTQGDDDDSGDDDDDDDTPAPLDLFEDFETGAPGWATSGLFHLTTYQSASPSHSMWMGDEASHDYDTGSQVVASLTSPAMDVRGTPAPLLLWEQILDVESDAEYDMAWVEVATEGGGYTNYSTVWEKAGTCSDWEMVEVDLSSYGGEKIKLRFSFDSTDDYGNDTSGWFIDNVWVTGQ